jgi:hypothetical protein
MSLKGPYLAADLSELMMIGTVDLPTLAYVYAEMGRRLAVSNEDGPAFAVAGASGSDQVGVAWTALRDRLEGILSGTSQALSAAGDTILYIAQQYENTDQDAKASLQSVWANGVPRDKLGPSEILPPARQAAQ